MEAFLFAKDLIQCFAECFTAAALWVLVYQGRPGKPF
jgi:hypothetical protein